MSLLRKIIKKFFTKFFKFKIFVYDKILSDTHIVQGKAIINQPTLFLGAGQIHIAKNVSLGYYPSPFFYSGYMHIEARNKTSIIEIGSNTYINNNATIVSDGANISIGKDCLIGPNFTCFDSDFHRLEPHLRLTAPTPKSVNIGDNVFIGANVTILKGVSIGKNCVVGGGSVVTKSFPQNCIIAGNPARVVGRL